jgi:hypothetical protein
MSTLPNWLVSWLIVFSAVGVIATVWLLAHVFWHIKEFLVARRDFYRRGAGE